MAKNSFQDLPLDILLDIIPRLPTLSFIVFKSVCKSWNTSAQHPSLAPHIEKLFRYPIFVVHSHSDTNTFDLIHESPINPTSSEKGVTKFTMPFKDPGYILLFLLSCRGLLCLVYGQLTGMCRRKVCICNPLVGKYNILQDPNHNQSNSFMDWYGFGFEPVAKDYKVVRIVNRGIPPCQNVQVFTLGKDTSWRTLPIERVQDKVHYSVVYMSGGIHWRFNRNWCIGYIDVFNLLHEKFETLQYPRSEIGSVDCMFAVIRGSLSIVTMDRSLDIWCMEYGLVSSWTKTYRIDSLPDIYWQSGYRSVLQNGDIIYSRYNGNLIYYRTGENKADSVSPEVVCPFSQFKAASLAASNAEPF